MIGGLFMWEQSKVVITPDPTTLCLSSAKTVSVGDLLLAGDTLHLTIEVEGTPPHAFFNISTGKLKA